MKNFNIGNLVILHGCIFRIIAIDEIEQYVKLIGVEPKVYGDYITSTKEFIEPVKFDTNFMDQVQNDLTKNRFKIFGVAAQFGIEYDLFYFGNFFIKIKYVHQLQNIFSSLTNKQLL